ncbi:MAG: DUF1036 domain-containing protein [Pseudomonadota bacterium]|nr:DUF1036 domain-containing protein [Pseudomonadota bacterium]
MPFLRRFSPPLVLGILAFVTVLTGFEPSAHAAMVFCNRTQAALDVALGYRGELDEGKTDWISEGWWRIEPGQCSRVHGKPLTQRFYYYYAVSLATPALDKSPTVWKGKYQFCTDAKAFRAEGDTACEDRGLQLRGFQEVDVGVNTRDYTLDFHDGN